MNASVKIWLHGLAGAFVGGAAAALSGAISMPNTFNFSRAGMLNMARIGAGSGLASAFLYLKQSPLWAMRTTATLTETPQKTTLEISQSVQSPNQPEMRKP
jgi:hypothetical protein